MVKLAVLASGNGTALRALLPKLTSSKLQISLVISDRPKAPVLEFAKQKNIATEVILSKYLHREQFCNKICSTLNNYQIDGVVLIGFMKILTAKFVNEWQHNIINVHPSLLPKHKGLMDLDVHQHVLKNKEPTSGCTVHYVTADVDEGHIILQKQCEVLETDTPEALKARVQLLESQALYEAIYKLYGSRDEPVQNIS